MFHYLSEDPWPLAYALGLLAFFLLIALWTTQQGRYLLWAGIILAVGLTAFGVERVWVTDAERIEAVVYELARAVEASDSDRVLGLLAPEAALVVEDASLEPEATAAKIRGLLDSTRFDYVRVSRLQAKAGRLTRVGTAEFRVQAMGTVEFSIIRSNYMTPPDGIDWSLGFRETDPGVWKITRITPLRTPPGFTKMLSLPAFRGRREADPS